jgi:hypothetical protein
MIILVLFLGINHGFATKVGHGWELQKREGVGKGKGSKGACARGVDRSIISLVMLLWVISEKCIIGRSRAQSAGCSSAFCLAVRDEGNLVGSRAIPAS